MTPIGCSHLLNLNWGMLDPRNGSRCLLPTNPTIKGNLLPTQQKGPMLYTCPIQDRGMLDPRNGSRLLLPKNPTIKGMLLPTQQKRLMLNTCPTTQDRGMLDP